MDLDALDQLAASAFDGYIVRKDLVRTFSRQYPVPTYVVEFLLGRYCASINPDEIAEGLEVVSRQLATRSVRAGEEELFKARAKEKGSIKVIDLISARLDARTDSFLATLPSLQIRDVRIEPDLVSAHERMLTGGFYAEVDLAYDAAIAQEKNGRPFGIATLREIQLSKRDVLDTVARGRDKFTTAEWKDLLIRSIGLERGAGPRGTRSAPPLAGGQQVCNPAASTFESVSSRRTRIGKDRYATWLSGSTSHRKPCRAISRFTERPAALRRAHAPTGPDRWWTGKLWMTWHRSLRKPPMRPWTSWPTSLRVVIKSWSAASR